MVQAEANSLPLSQNPGLKWSSPSASFLAKTTDMCHHAWLIFLFFAERGSHYIAQVGFKLLGSIIPPTWASQSAGITGRNHHAQPLMDFFKHLLHLLNQQINHLPFSLNFRLCLAYGGSDVSRCFYWLMQRAGFPYRECQLTNKMDCLLLQHLKETFCHLDQVGAESILLIIFVSRKNLRDLKDT